MDPRPAAQGDGDKVRHAEVGPHAADLDRDRGLAGKPVDEDADVGRCAADVNHGAVSDAGKESRTPDRVRWAARDGQDWVAHGVVEGHERPVVLAEEEPRIDSMLAQRPLEARRRGACGDDDGGVQDRRVFALQQAQTADLVRVRQREIAQDVAQHLAGALFVRGIDSRECADHRQRVDVPLKRLRCLLDRADVERTNLATVVFVPALDDRVLAANRGAQVFRPANERRNGQSSRCPDADQANPVQVGALEDRVRAMGRPEHRVLDGAEVQSRVGLH